MEDPGPISISQYSPGQLDKWAQILRDSGRYAVLEKHQVRKFTAYTAVDNRMLASFKDSSEHDRFIDHVCGSVATKLGNEIASQGFVERSISRAEEWCTQYVFTAYVIRPPE